ncbi:hypothetical protein H6P81_006736 [Aristolochia fimbriata]|uniref:Uncharacterized protein n=1 Tax=Aristolochia fimbriata TaxID=158543 RepID=A0AAV7EYC7_ARIFI|nr:hypothetical protein H6P81_006736 [Aristolochia fimbriata]
MTLGIHQRCINLSFGTGTVRQAGKDKEAKRARGRSMCSHKSVARFVVLDSMGNLQIGGLRRYFSQVLV